MARDHINCAVFAWRLWRKRGGYLIIRWSRALKGVPHFLWAPDHALDDNTHVRHYTPLKPTSNRWAFWKALHFWGRVKYCDRNQCPNTDPLCQKCRWRR